ncbi:MAG: FtsX-like permease family protein [Thermodesulfobacteriota bacterium]|nr:FtsX-like permease family protein [Thermodesulfobacteriota bacterium]
MNLMLKYSLRNILRDKKSVIVNIILLIAAVVAYILFPSAAKSAFMAIKKYGFKDTVIIMEKGNLKLAFSRVDEELYQFVKTAPHVKKKGGEPLVSPYLQMSSVFGNQFLMLRGITDIFYKIRGETFKIVQGRGLKYKYDILIGFLVSKRLGKPFKVGDILSLENRKWKIVGIFKAKGDPAESGALVRMEDFKEVSARGTYSYIEIKADSPKNIPKLNGYVNMAFEMLHDEFPDSPAIMALPEKQYWEKLAKMFKMAVLVGKTKAAVIVVCMLLFIMNISHSFLMKRTDEIRILSNSGVPKLGIFSGMLFEIFIVSIVAGIIGGVIAVACSGMTVNLQLATIILKIKPSAILKGVVLAIILGCFGAILPIIKLSFSHHQRLKD